MVADTWLWVFVYASRCCSVTCSLICFSALDASVFVRRSFFYTMGRKMSFLSFVQTPMFSVPSSSFSLSPI